MKPLQRKPKQLTEEPALYEPAGGRGAGLVIKSERGTGSTKPAPPGDSAPGITGDSSDLRGSIPAAAELDLEAIKRARRIAARLAIARPRNRIRARRGVGELASVRYRGASDDLDLDATLEKLAEHPVLEEDDIVVRERISTRRSVVLAVDVSGSMKGERARTAAATVGALCSELSRDDLAIVAFWSDAAILVPLRQPTSPDRVLELLLSLPARGLTNVAFPLRLAAKQLRGVPARDARVLLLSDCVHNAGPDPREAAGQLARLDVLLDTSGEHDLELGRDLARAGHGRIAIAHKYQDVAAALTRLFAA